MNVRRLTGRRDGRRPVEHGAPRAPDVEHGRIRDAQLAQRRRLASRRMRRRIPAGIVVAVIAGLLGAHPYWWAGLLSAVILGAGVVAWPLVTLPGAHSGPAASWATWRDGRHRMDRALREGLDGNWHLLWDRRIPDWNRPVTIAVGPTGLWALWGTEPGYLTEAPRLATLVAEMIGAPPALVTCQAGQPWLDHQGCDAMVTRVLVAPVVLGPADIARWVDRVDATLLQDLSGAVEDLGL